MFNFIANQITQFINTMIGILVHLLAFVGNAVMIVMTAVAFVGSIVIAILLVLSVIMMVQEVVHNHKYEG